MNRHDRRTEANPEASHRAFPLAFAIAAQFERRIEEIFHPA